MWKKKKLKKFKIRNSAYLFIELNIGENGMNTPCFTEHTVGGWVGGWLDSIGKQNKQTAKKKMLKKQMFTKKFSIQTSTHTERDEYFK